jgi:hypothetical protein
MAFTGTPVVQMLSNSICRITGVSLGAGASGTIGLAARTTPGEVTLPASFEPKPYTLPGSGGLVDLIEALDVDAKPTTTGAIVVATPVHVGKAGATPETFLATLTNPSGAATQTLEIYVKFHE